MQDEKLSHAYRSYIGCLNTQDWQNLSQYVADNVAYNGEVIGYAAYLKARQDEFRDIPDLHFSVRIVIENETMVACRLDFNISPSSDFLGLAVNGQLISFSENVFYEFENGKISKVWSVVDKAAVEAQLSSAEARRR